jgi:hypothetical protein
VCGVKWVGDTDATVIIFMRVEEREVDKVKGE